MGDGLMPSTKTPRFSQQRTSSAKAQCPTRANLLGISFLQVAEGLKPPIGSFNSCISIWLVLGDFRLCESFTMAPGLGFICCRWSGCCCLCSCDWQLPKNCDFSEMEMVGRVVVQIDLVLLLYVAMHYQIYVEYISIYFILWYKAMRVTMFLLLFHLPNMTLKNNHPQIAPHMLKIDMFFFQNRGPLDHCFRTSSTGLALSTSIGYGMFECNHEHLRKTGSLAFCCSVAGGVFHKTIDARSTQLQFIDISVSDLFGGIYIHVIHIHLWYFLF